jgi:hypothetical protein
LPPLAAVWSLLAARRPETATARPFNRLVGLRAKRLKEEELMPRSNSRGGRNNNPSGRNQYSDWGVMELARERPIAAAAAAAGAAAAGLFLWSKRNQISQQLSNLSDQIGDWTENMGSGAGDGLGMDDTAGLTTASGTRSGAGSRSASGSRSGSRGRSGTSGTTRGMSETGGGNASLGAQSGGMGTTTAGSPSGRSRASDNS